MSEEKQAAEAAEVEEKGAEVADQFAAADAQADPVDPPSIEELASQMGWVPEEKFRGPKDKWKPADRFILDGKDIQERSSRELKEIRTTLETIKATSGSIMADKLQEERDKMARAYEAAVEKGDTEAAAAALRRYDATDQRLQAVGHAPSAPAPETEQWVSRNSRVMKDPLAAKRALQVCDEYAKANYSVPDQLASTEAVIRREFPHLFDDKPAPAVNAPARASVAQSAGKTSKDLPKDAREIANDLVERGLIPSVDAYAKNYFAAQAKRA